MAYLYIFENNAFPGNVKIGCTAKHPSARARELFTTGVPSPFYVSHTWEIPEGEMYQIEKDIHKYLRNFRANNSREFFRISAKLAHKHIEEYLSNYTDIIEKREIAKARTSAIYQWENVRENIWNESLQSAETELGYTFESLRNASNDLGVNLKNIILAIVSFGTLLIVPVVLGFLGFDFDSKTWVYGLWNTPSRKALPGGGWRAGSFLACAHVITPVFLPAQCRKPLQEAGLRAFSAVPGSPPGAN